jgi:hypothetical protein
MEAAAFEAVKRMDDVFYQPVLIGTKREKVLLRIFLSIASSTTLGGRTEGTSLDFSIHS